MPRKWIIWIYVFIIIVGIAVLIRLDGPEDFSIISDQSISLNRSWEITTESLSETGVSLPAKMDVDPGSKYTMSTRVPAFPGRDIYLLIRASMQDVTISLDDELIQEHALKTVEKIPFMPQASLWVMVPLPDAFVGKKLTLTIKSDIAVFSGIMNEVRMGDKSDLFVYVIKSQFVGILVFLILFITGLVVIALTTILKSFKDNRILYLGFLSVITSLWIISESRVLQFFTGNRFILGGISYIMVPMMGLFIVLFLKEAVAVDSKIKRRLQWVAAGYGFTVVVLIVAQTLFNIPFIVAMQIASGVMILLMGTAMGVLYYEYKKMGNNTAREFRKYILIVLLSIVLEAFVFYTGRFAFTSAFLRIGILIVLSGLLVDSYLFLKESIETQKEHQLLEILAYKDFLTGGGNRTAYERDLEKILSHNAFRLVLMDMNYLKQINDAYGHAKGDIAIKAVFDTIEKCFSDYGTCYRIGGDEFTVLMEDVDETLYQKCYAALEKELEVEKDKIELPLEIAVGSDVYMQKTWRDYKKFYHHVDQKMYENKLYRKTNRNMQEVIWSLSEK